MRFGKIEEKKNNKIITFKKNYKIEINRNQNEL